MLRQYKYEKVPRYAKGKLTAHAPMTRALVSACNIHDAVDACVHTHEKHTVGTGTNREKSPESHPLTSLSKSAQTNGAIFRVTCHLFHAATVLGTLFDITIHCIFDKNRKAHTNQHHKTTARQLPIS